MNKQFTAASGGQSNDAQTSLSAEEIIRLLTVGQLATNIYEKGFEDVAPLVRDRADKLCATITEGRNGPNHTPLIPVFKGKKQGEETTNFVLANGDKDLSLDIRQMADALIFEMAPLGYTAKIRNSSLGFWVVRLKDDGIVADKMAIVANRFSGFVQAINEDIAKEHAARQYLNDMGIKP